MKQKNGERPVEIMVAKRNRPDATFGEPQRLGLLDGFVEAPSLTLNKNELFFHKKQDNRFYIYRATRSNQ